MAAALLSLSAATPRVPSSQFKGDVLRLRTGSLSLTKQIAPKRPSTPLRVSAVASAPAASSSSSAERFRLDNLGPQPGSRKKGKRKGRGYAAGQGGSCGFGMRGQKSRSGPGVRRGFEGGQMPLYRRLPKLRGIAGGMHAGLPKFVPVNLKDIEAAGFQDGDEVSLESLKEKGLINPSGRERRLPLKILGDGEGEFSMKLNIKARAFSAGAREKLEAAGCTLTVLPGRKKWVKPSVATKTERSAGHGLQANGPAEEEKFLLLLSLLSPPLALAAPSVLGGAGFLLSGAPPLGLLLFPSHLLTRSLLPL